MMRAANKKIHENLFRRLRLLNAAARETCVSFSVRVNQKLQPVIVLDVQCCEVCFQIIPRPQHFSSAGSRLSSIDWGALVWHASTLLVSTALMRSRCLATERACCSSLANVCISPCKIAHDGPLSALCINALLLRASSLEKWNSLVHCSRWSFYWVMRLPLRRWLHAFMSGHAANALSPRGFLLFEGLPASRRSLLKWIDEEVEVEKDGPFNSPRNDNIENILFQAL